MKLKELRLKKKVTQADVAASIGITPQVFSRYERGDHEADYKTLIKLADFFNCTVDELLGRVPEQQLFDDSRVDRPEILELLDQMTPAEQMSVVSYARGILSSRSLRSDADSRFYKTNA